MRVLGLGDNVCDMYLSENIMYPGGQALNFAVYAKALGAEAHFMGVFGNDLTAGFVMRAMEKKGIEHPACRIAEGENAYAKIIHKDGDRIFLGSNRGGVLREHPLKLSEEDRCYISSFDLIHTDQNSYTDGLLPELYRLPPLISYDFSWRWQEEERMARVCPYIDIAFLSCSGLSDAETRDICLKFQKAGCPVVVVTRGTDAAVVYAGGRFFQKDVVPVVPTDTIGAGDSFAAALLVTLFSGCTEKEKERGAFRKQEGALALSRTWEAALERAADFSARTCLIHGSWGEGEIIPEEIKKFFDI